MMKVLLSLYCCLALAGCSTMVNGVNREISLNNSHMSKINTTLEYNDTKRSVEMPLTLNMYSDNSRPFLSIAISDECYESKQYDIQSKLAVSYWLNVFNIFGFFVDYATGAMWQLPESVILPVNRLENCSN